MHLAQCEQNFLALDAWVTATRLVLNDKFDCLCFGHELVNFHVELVFRGLADFRLHSFLLLLPFKDSRSSSLEWLTKGVACALDVLSFCYGCTRNSLCPVRDELHLHLSTVECHVIKFLHRHRSIGVSKEYHLSSTSAGAVLPEKDCGFPHGTDCAE